MAEISGFFKSINGDRKYTTDFLAQWVASIIGNGVYNGELAVAAGIGMQISLPVGRAWISGQFYRNTSALTKTIGNADGVLHRKDTVVLRWDINTRDITAQVLRGTPASSPVAPAIVRTAEQYDLKLAEISIPAGTTSITQALITDTRLNSSVCGLVTGVVSQVDITTLYNQIQADLAAFRTGREADFDAWVATIHNILDAETAGNLLLLINGLQSDLQSDGITPCTGAGTNTITVTNAHIMGYVDGLKITLDMGTSANTGAATININGMGAKSLVMQAANGSTSALVGGETAGFSVWQYKASIGSFVLLASSAAVKALKDSKLDVAALPGLNWLINGNFDFWQRGTSFSVSGTLGGYSADRWRYSDTLDAGATIVHQRQALGVGEVQGALYAFRKTITSTGGALTAGAYSALDQLIENGVRKLCDTSVKKITISFWARSNVAGKKLGVHAAQEYGSGGSPSSADQMIGKVVTLTSIWTKYTVTLDTITLSGKTFGSNNDDALRFRFWTAWGSTFSSRFDVGGVENLPTSGYVDIAQVKLEAGSVATPFIPRSKGEELAICQRYFEKSYDLDTIPGAATSAGGRTAIAGSNKDIQGPVLKVTKRIAPTIAVYSIGGVVNRVSNTGNNNALGTSFTPSEGSQNGPRWITDSGTPFTANAFYDYHWTAEAEI